MAKRGIKRKLKRTVTFVGEGSAEKAFLLHIRSIYGKGDPKVTPKSAGGKGPTNVITEAINTFDSTNCSSVAALLDSDIKWPDKLVNKAKSKGVLLIASDPCFEGLLIDILGLDRPKPCTNNSCKKIIHPILPGRETDKNSYYNLFDYLTLEKARKDIKKLDTLIKVFTDSL